MNDKQLYQKIVNELARLNLIDKLLEGELSDEEFELIAPLLKDNPALITDILIIDAVKAASKKYAEEKRKKIKEEFNLNAIHHMAMRAMEAEEADKFKKNFRRKVIYYTAACFSCLAIFLALSIYWLYSPAEEIAKEISALVTLNSVTHTPCQQGRVQTDNTAENFEQKIIYQYLNCNFDGCINLYETADSTKELNIEALFYVANAYLAIGKTKEAYALLQGLAELTKTDDHGCKLCRDFSHFYTALRHVEEGKPERAEKLIAEMDKAPKYEPANQQRIELLQWKLVVYYLNQKQVEDADRVLSKLDNHKAFKIKTKLLTLF